MVCPFVEILHSGSLLLALSFDRPVLVPELGAMRETRDEVGAEWIKTYQGQLTGDVLLDALRWAITGYRSLRPQLEHLDWLSIGRRTAEFYERLVVQT